MKVTITFDGVPEKISPTIARDAVLRALYEYPAVRPATVLHAVSKASFTTRSRQAHALLKATHVEVTVEK